MTTNDLWNSDAGETKPSRRRLRARAAVTSAGALMIILALAPELARTGVSGFGAAQTALLVVGTVVLLVGAIGARVVNAYRATAVILLNFVVLAGMLELAAGLLLSRTHRQQTKPHRSYYDDKPWGARFALEERASIEKSYYRPFALWMRGRATGQTVNVNADGVRLTLGANCVPDAYRVFVLGGSTTWGAGSPDWGTYSSYLQGALARRTPQPVCVLNLGELGYTSTQELVFLATELGSGHIPNLVIFYDGVNDVRTAADYGRPGLHYLLKETASKLEGDKPPLLVRAHQSRLVRLLLPERVSNADSSWIAGYRQRGVHVDSLADQVVATYLQNHRMVGALARDYGFAYAFFWQPVIWYGEKPLTPEEQRAQRWYAVHGVPELYRAVYDRIRDAAARESNLYDIADVFEGHPESVYLDWNHVTPEGNAIIAGRMVAVLDQRANGIFVPVRTAALATAPPPTPDGLPAMRAHPSTGPATIRLRAGEVPARGAHRLALPRSQAPGVARNHLPGERVGRTPCHYPAKS